MVDHPDTSPVNPLISVLVIPEEGGAPDFSALKSEMVSVLQHKGHEALKQNWQELIGHLLQQDLELSDCLVRLAAVVNQAFSTYDPNNTGNYLISALTKIEKAVPYAGILSQDSVLADYESPVILTAEQTANLEKFKDISDEVLSRSRSWMEATFSRQVLEQDDALSMLGTELDHIKGELLTSMLKSDDNPIIQLARDVSISTSDSLRQRFFEFLSLIPEENKAQVVKKASETLERQEDLDPAFYIELVFGKIDANGKFANLLTNELFETHIGESMISDKVNFLMDLGEANGIFFGQDEELVYTRLTVEILKSLKEINPETHNATCKKLKESHKTAIASYLIYMNKDVEIAKQLFKTLPQESCTSFITEELEWLLQHTPASSDRVNYLCELSFDSELQRFALPKWEELSESAQHILTTIRELDSLTPVTKSFLTQLLDEQATPDAAQASRVRGATFAYQETLRPEDKVVDSWKYLANPRITITSQTEKSIVSGEAITIQTLEDTNKKTFTIEYDQKGFRHLSIHSPDGHLLRTVSRSLDKPDEMLESTQYRYDKTNSKYEITSKNRFTVESFHSKLPIVPKEPHKKPKPSLRSRP